MSQLYVARILEDGPFVPSLSEWSSGTGLTDVDLEDLSTELGVEPAAPGLRSFVAALKRLGPQQAKARIEQALAPAEMRKALESERLDLAEGLDFFQLPMAWLGLLLLDAMGVRSSQPPCRRLVVEAATIHPDAGLPSPKRLALRRFLLRLLADADDVPYSEQRIFAYLTRRGGKNAFYEMDAAGCGDDVPGIIWVPRCLKRKPLEVESASFWSRHRKEWWASSKLDIGSSPTLLRDWLKGGDDPGTYAVASYEVWLHPCWLERPHTGIFTSTAFWS